MNRTAFFDNARDSLFGGSLTQAQVSRLDALLDAWEVDGDGDANKLAYLFGTGFHEGARFTTGYEKWGPTPAQRRYEGRADLGNTQKGDGYRFRGRGFLSQLTGRRNYGVMSKKVGVDLVADPDKAADDKLAARIGVIGAMQGLFTGKKLGDYIRPGSVDFRNARRVINGTDKADLIAGYARKFAGALKAAEHGVPVALVEVPAPPEEITALEKPAWKQGGIWERCTQIFGGFGIAGAAAFTDWKVVVAIAVVLIVIAVLGLLLHKRLIRAAKDLAAEMDA